ncbi:unnamed protein product [Adineta steineri]|uniref:SAM domain-containing protein n=1 Tax=Adineta steineri TaxID=433720 RepID=A0A813ZDH0_9BILA|nr:unnamed protein product [Adineta steineri]
MYRTIVYIILFIYLFQPCQLHNNIAYNIPDPDCTGPFNLCTDDDKERLGRLAIKAIHEQMDDDKDGMIEPSESSEFIQEELGSKTDAIRYRNFQSADLQITYNDLWIQWHQSPVYNWTTDDVVNWLVNFAHLPMYVENFRRNQIDGRVIPRLAANEKHYLSGVMQIRDLRHKRRLIIKATDVVLFGPPPRTHNLIKDVILMSAVFISFGACLYAYVRHRRTQESMNTMIKELEALQKAEGDLVSVTGKIKAMENELQDKKKVDRGTLSSWFVEVQQNKEEAEKYRKRRNSTVDHEKQLRLAVQETDQLRIALRKAEEHAHHQSYEAPSELIELLKRTYHIEETAFEIKRKSAENAMLVAKEQMIKISKMQRGFFGAVRIAHTGCMDNISELIHAAKERLADVQDEYEERERRWNRIASLLDRDDIISNASLSTPSTGSNQYSLGNTNPLLTNGNNNNGSAVSRIRDSTVRSKQTSLDANKLINTDHDSSMINKNSSSMNNRGASMNSSYPAHISQLDTISLTDSNFDYPNSPSTALKRRTVTHNIISGNRSSTERLLNNSAIRYSQSTNGLYDTNINSSNVSRQDTSDSIDIPSLPKQTKPIFDIITDLQNENNEFILDDQDRKSHRFDSLSDDQQSVASSTKSRKQDLSTKLLRPFHIRLRKKSGS